MPPYQNGQPAYDPVYHGATDHTIDYSDISAELPIETQQLLKLAKKNGYLMGRNSALEDANRSLTATGDKLLSVNQRQSNEIERLQSELSETYESRDAYRDKAITAERQAQSLLTERSQLKTDLAAAKKKNVMLSKCYFFSGYITYDNNQSAPFDGVVKIPFWKTPLYAYRKAKQFLEEESKFFANVKINFEYFEKV